MDIQNQSFLSIEQLTDRYLSQRPLEEKGKTADISFKDVLQKKTIQEIAATHQSLKFSKHASGRLSDRGIELSDAQMERLTDGVRRAGQKGIKDSLVIVDELAFIVNVPNNTVVTAMDSRSTDENIFTNINGAVIM